MMRTEKIAEITRSHTIDAFSSERNGEISTFPTQQNVKLQRNASNGNLMNSRKSSETAAAPPVPSFERSHSMDTGDLSVQMKRSLSLNDTGMSMQMNNIDLNPMPSHSNALDSPIFSPGTTTFGVGMFSPPPAQQVQPPSPYYNGQAFPLGYDQGQGFQNVFGSLVTPLHTGIQPSPAFTPMMYSAQYPPYSPATMMYGAPERLIYSSPSPYTPPTQVPVAGIHNLQLPGAAKTKMSLRSVSIRSADQHSANAPYGYESKSRVERMLQELRVKAKGGMPTTSRVLNGQRPMQFNDSSVTWTLADIQGVAYDFAKDQFGSRFIQSNLQDSSVSQQDKDALFNELVPNLSSLCKDVFGNYVIQKLFDLDVGTRAQHNIIYQKAVKGNMYELSKHMYGCRVIQKLVEVIFGFTSTQKSRPVVDEEDIYNKLTQDMLLQELMDVQTFVSDQNGNHVIQKCISFIKPTDRLKLFYEKFEGKYVEMSKHPYGCRVVQRVLEHADLGEVSKVIVEIEPHLHDMVLNQYANYVVQHLVHHQNDDSSTLPGAISSFTELKNQVQAQINLFRQKLYETIAANVLTYSRHKFGSNVVEACIKHGSRKEKEVLIKKVIEPNVLVHMMQDQYANYVVQKVIDNASLKQYEVLLSVVQQNEPALRRLTFGKHIINKLKSHRFD